MVTRPVNGTSPDLYRPVHSLMADELTLLFRSFGASATLVQTNGGVILEGDSATYYGKLMAHEIARRAELVVVANRIRVHRTGIGRTG